MPDGYPQTHPVWFTWEEPSVCINIMRGFRKERNMRADPRVAVLLLDPDRCTHWLEIHGTVALTEKGAEAHLDQLARLYTGTDRYFGSVVPAELRAREVPVKGRITPLRILTDVQTVHPPGRYRPTSLHRPAGPPLRRSIDIPAPHRDLFDRHLIATLSTRLPGGQPQTRPVWCDVDHGAILVNTTPDDRSAPYLEADPRACVLVIDPDDSARWIEVRGDIETTDGARLQLWPRRIVCDAIHASRTAAGGPARVPADEGP
jgi:PPOX class probable F420-dependent enzyme